MRIKLSIAILIIIAVPAAYIIVTTRQAQQKLDHAIAAIKQDKSFKSEEQMLVDAKAIPEEDNAYTDLWQAEKILVDIKDDETWGKVISEGHPIPSLPANYQSRSSKRHFST